MHDCFVANADDCVGPFLCVRRYSSPNDNKMRLISATTMSSDVVDSIFNLNSHRKGLFCLDNDILIGT